MAPGAPLSRKAGADGRFLPEFLMGALPDAVGRPVPDLRGRTVSVWEFWALLAGLSPLPAVVPTDEERRDPPPVRSRYDLGRGSVPLGSSTPAMKKTSSLGRSPLVGTMASTPGRAPSMLSPASAWQRRSMTLSPAQPDRFYAPVYSRRAEDQLDGRWVTVYGFSQASASYILHQFAQYGNILKHVMSNTGNWMHICYQSELEARKALSKDGRIFGDCIRIGVKPCTDKSVMARSSTSTSVDGTAVQHINHTTRFPTMRPLACKACASHYQVFLERQTPRKGESIVSKALGYVFGCLCPLCVLFVSERFSQCGGSSGISTPVSAGRGSESGEARPADFSGLQPTVSFREGQRVLSGGRTLEAKKKGEGRADELTEPSYARQLVISVHGTRVRKPTVRYYSGGWESGAESV
ncbi:nucleoporin NUP35-like [Numenius arquata]|uniref:nucleoporin NUP35-like n=1 Tax=Numenius arquata TaxID=31919 RepID=UPI003D30BBDD